MATNNYTCTNASARINASSDGDNPFAGDPVIFHTPSYVANIHLSSIRLGRTNNVTVLLDGTEEQQIEYVEGILIAAIVIFCFFTVWLMTIFILKCCGHKRVGFFSGQRIRRPMPPTPPHEVMGSLFVSGGNGEQYDNETDEEKANRILLAISNHNHHSKTATAPTEVAVTGMENANDDKAVNPNGAEEQEYDTIALNETETKQDPQTETVKEKQEQLQQVATITASDSNSTLSPAMLEYRDKVVEWQHQVKKAEKRQRRIRIVVIFCCVGVIISSILMLVYGVDALVNSVNDAQVGLAKISNLSSAGIELIDQFQSGQNTTVNVTESMLLNLNEICPLVQDQLCSNISTATDCNYTGIPNEQEVQELVEYFSGISEMIYDELDETKDDLQEIIDLTAEIDAKFGSFEWAFWVSAVFVMLLAVLTVFIIIGVVLAWNGKLNDSCFRWVRNLLVVPLFVLLVFLSLLFACIFVVGSITTADVCYDSPDPLVLQLLAKMESEFEPVIYRFITFYISGCPNNDVPLDMNSQVNQLYGYLDKVSSLLQKLEDNPILLDTCGVSETSLIDSLKEVVALICFLTTLMLDVRDYFNCNNWNPVYATFAYDAVCYNATQGFVWISSTQFVIVFFAMMIVMLRVACYEIEDEEDFQKQRRRCARLCCCFAKPKETDNVDGLMKPLDPTPAEEPKEDEGRSLKDEASVGI